MFRKIQTCLIMKKNYAFLLFFGFACSVYAQFPAPYCPVTFPNGVEPITLVELADINNTNPAATSGAVAHIDFTNISGTVIPGTPYSVTVNGNTDGAFTNHITVFIDWNQDGNFDGPNETFQLGSIYNNPGNGTPVTGTIDVPVDAAPGATRMRVTKRFSSPAIPCNNSGYGQAQDYTIVVNAGAPCNGTPTVGAVTASETTICTGIPLTLSADVTPTMGYSYQWESSTDNGSTWVALGSPQSTVTYIVASQSQATSYRLVVTCTTDNLSATSAAVDVAQSPFTDCYCTNAINYVCNDGDLILNVTFGSINNDSTCSEPTGYSDFTNSVTPAQIEAGTSENISVTVGPSGDGWQYESVGVFIDFNQNGVFDDSEFTYVGTGLNEALSGNIVIPADAVIGVTRMRVIVSASTATGFGPQHKCGPTDSNNPFGEMEDYAVEITPALSIGEFENSKFSMYPNPTNGIVTLNFAQATPVQSISVYSITGQQIISKPITNISKEYSLDLGNTADGIYMVKVQTENGQFIKRIVKQ